MIHCVKIELIHLSTRNFDNFAKFLILFFHHQAKLCWRDVGGQIDTEGRHTLHHVMV